MPAVHFGVTVPQIKRTWEESCSNAREFEAMGYDSLWVCDHLYGPQSPTIPILEAWSLLIGSVLLFAALAGVMYATRNIDWSSVGRGEGAVAG